MSDISRGPGWWIASDGKWYPPQPAPVSSHQIPSLGQTGNTKAFFRNSQYLGGLPGIKKADGNLHVTDAGIGIGNAVAKRGMVIWSDMASISFDSAVAAKSKVGATLMFGVLGALAAKGTQDTATVTVNLEDGNVGFYRVLGKSGPMVRAGFQPFLNSYAIVCLDDQLSISPPHSAIRSNERVPASSIGVADELAKLSSLRDQGVLSDEEFADMKQQLLGRFSSASGGTSDAGSVGKASNEGGGERHSDFSVLPPPPLPAPPEKDTWRAQTRQELDAQSEDGVNPIFRTVPSPFGPRARKERKERKAAEKARNEKRE